TQQLRYELHDKTLRLAWEDLTKGRPKEMKTATDSTFGISTFQRDELPRKPPKEKKEPKDNDQAVSWGKPIDGIQSGIAVVPSKQKVVKIGDTLTLKHLVCNVKDVPLTVYWVKEYPTALFFTEEVHGMRRLKFEGEVFDKKMQRKLAPGEVYEIDREELTLYPDISIERYIKVDPKNRALRVS